ncbi:hypothetical protein V8E36_005359 [Tilletia maclaganii]
MEPRPGLCRTEFGSFADNLADAGGVRLVDATPMRRVSSGDSDIIRAPTPTHEHQCGDVDLDAARTLTMHALESRERLFAHSRGNTVNSDGYGAPSEHPHVLFASQADRRFVPPLMLLGPVLGVLFVTAGLATFMVIWVKLHMLPLSSDGVVYIREGTESEGDRTYHDPVLGASATLRFEEQISHATTLSISSAISTLVGNSVFPLMGLVTYSLASSWLQLQTDIARRSSYALTEQLPTPLQFALLTQICGANSFEAVWNTARHMARSRRTRTTIPSILTKAFAWLTSLLLLTSAIAALDVYLHETMKTVQVLDINPIETFANFTWTLNNTLCMASALSLNQPPCLVAAPTDTSYFPVWAESGNFAVQYVEPEGWLVANNASKDHNIQTVVTNLLPDTNNSTRWLSFVDSPQVRNEDIFDSKSIGMSAQCEMIIADCKPTSQSFNCAAAGQPQISIGTTTMTLPSGSQASNLASHLYISDPQGGAMLGPASTIGAQSNPLPVSALITYSVQLQVTPEDQGFENFIVGAAPGSDGAPASGQTTWMYGALSCSLALYELELSFFNSSYTFDAIRLADPGLLHALSGPIVSGALTDAVASAVARVAGRVPADRFADLFGAELGYNAMAFSTGMLQALPVAVNSWQPILASQYSLPALVAYLALLYAYALCAIILFFWAWGMSSDCVEYYDPISGEKVAVPAVVLAQRQLMEPGHVIALHLTNGAGGGGGAGTPASGPGFGGAAMPTKSTQLPSAMMPSTSQSQLMKSSDPEKNAAMEARESVSPAKAAAIRTVSTDLLDLFEDSALVDRVVVGLESRGHGFGVWPVQTALGAIGQGRARDSLLRTQNLFWSSWP